MYLGDMVQKKEETIFKTNGKKISHDKDKWIIVKNTHEPIINTETFKNVQSLVKFRTRKLKFGENVTVYAGILKCADCGRAMSKTKFKNVAYYKCGSYKQLGKNYCSSHSIREDVLSEIVLHSVRNEAYYSLDKQDITRLTESIETNTINENRKEIDMLKSKLKSIARYKKRAYEDFVDKILRKEEYINYKKEYEQEENTIMERVSSLNEKSLNLDEVLVKHNEYIRRFIQYIDVDALTREIMVELIEYIKIHDSKEIVIKFKFEPH